MKKILNTDFKIPKIHNLKRESSTKIDGGSKLKRLENTSNGDSDLPSASKYTKLLDKNNDRDSSDEDCLSIMCESIQFMEDFIDKPVVIQRPSQTAERTPVLPPLKKGIKSRLGEKRALISSEEPNITPQESNGSVESGSKALFDSAFEEDCPSNSDNTLSIKEENITKRQTTHLKGDLNQASIRKQCVDTRSKSTRKMLSASADTWLQKVNPACHSEDEWKYQPFSLKNILDNCHEWSCRARNLHEIPNSFDNLDNSRAEELSNSVIGHLPLFIKSIFGSQALAVKRNQNILGEQLLESIKMALNGDDCFAISVILETAWNSFKHYKIIHNILSAFIRNQRYIRNLLEAVRPLLSISNFRWPLWLQEKIVRNLVNNRTIVSKQDYTALFRVLSSELFDQLLKPESESHLQCYKHNDSKSFRSLTMRSPPRNFHISTAETPKLPLSTLPSHFPTYNHANQISMEQNLIHSFQPDKCFEVANLVANLVLENKVPSAIDNLKKLDLGELCDVAHNIFVYRASEYVNVVHILMSYLKNRNFIHLFNKNLNIFMSTLSFNLLVNYIKDESLEKAFSFFYEIKQAGFEYLRAQLFPESLGEVEFPSQMKTVLIAVDLCLNSDKYDEAAQIFIDNGLLGEKSEWKLTNATESDIELRDRYLTIIISSLLEDERPQMTLLASKLFTEMQKKHSSFTSNTLQISRLIRKLLSKSTWNKIAYDIFQNYYSNVDNGSKCNLAVNDPTLCRAMVVISRTVDPTNTLILFHEFLEWDVYPIWKLEDKTIIVHSNWVGCEMKMLIKNHIKRIVDRLKSPTTVLPCSSEFSILIEEFKSEGSIVVLQKPNSSLDATIDELQEILYALDPPIRSVSNKKQVFALNEDWKKHIQAHLFSFVK